MAPAAVQTSAAPLSPAGEVLNAQQFLSRASKTTKENPIKPEWPFVLVEGSNLNLGAHLPDTNLETLIQVPLAAGHYQLKASALLATTSEFPIELAIDLLQNGQPTRLLNQTFKPDQTVELAQAIQAPPAQGELLLTIKMAPGAKNNFGATLYLRDFALVKRP